MHISLLTFYACFDRNAVELLLLQQLPADFRSIIIVIMVIIMTSARSMRPLGRRDPEADAQCRKPDQYSLPRLCPPLRVHAYQHRPIHSIPSCHRHMRGNNEQGGLIENTVAKRSWIAYLPCKECVQSVTNRLPLVARSAPSTGGHAARVAGALRLKQVQKARPCSAALAQVDT